MISLAKRRSIAMQNFSTRKTLWKIAEMIFEGQDARVHRSHHVERLAELGLVALSPTESRRMFRAQMTAAGWELAPPKLRAFHALSPRRALPLQFLPWDRSFKMQYIAGPFQRDLDALTRGR